MTEAQIRALKERACQAIDAHRQEIIAIGEDIRQHPELGFKEQRTAGIVADRMLALGISHQTGLAVTGVKGLLPGDPQGPTVAYMGELDSVLVRDHPDADPTSGAAHACGHNAQIANLIALAYAFSDEDIMSNLDGSIALLAVPAEEYVEVEYRLTLKERGIIEFLGGKPELIRLGALDDVDMALMTHQSTRDGQGLLSVGGPSNGCVVKRIEYKGVAAHAGGAPHAGVNALKAAMLGLQAIDANRETFRDKDHIRVHPIITKGGDLVNVVPDDVHLETYVRGADVDAILNAQHKVDRALRAGAMAMGASITINTLPGYLPRVVCQPLAELYRRNAVKLVGEEHWWESEFSAGSTDLGDASHIMPAIEAQARGALGTGHGADYVIADEEMAYITPAKAAAMTLIDLLADDATKAHNILDSFQPRMSKADYLAFMRGLDREVTWSAEDKKA